MKSFTYDARIDTVRYKREYLQVVTIVAPDRATADALLECWMAENYVKFPQREHPVSVTETELPSGGAVVSSQYGVDSGL